MFKFKKANKIFIALGMCFLLFCEFILTLTVIAIDNSDEIFKQHNLLKIAVISDIHIFPEEYVGNEGPNYQKYVNGDRKMLKESTEILNSAVNRIISSDAEIVLIPGDLTKDSERLGHEIVAEKIKLLEDNGKQVFVINGNHDINAPDAEKFVAISGDANSSNAQDEVIPLQGVMADEFQEIYKDFGYSEIETIAQDPNSLSYVVQLKSGYVLIAMDTGIYGDEKKDQSTSGTLYRDGRLDWILNQISIAKANGNTIIGMAHHGFVEHFDGQGTVFAPYLVEDYENVANLLADYGMQFVFTGHFHAQDVAIKKTASDNTLMDIMTGSTASYPSPIRFVTIDSNTGRVHIESEKISKIKDIENFEAYGKDIMTNGVPNMVSSLLSDILIGFIDSNFPDLDNEIFNQIYLFINKKLKENQIEIEKIINNSEFIDDKDSVDIIPNLLSKKQLIAFIKAVCEDLKTVEIETSIKDNYKLMDAITYCLLEVYSGDENYSDEMKILKQELETTPTITNALKKILLKNKGKLGLIGLVITENMIDELLAIQINNTSLSTIISSAFANLLNGILSDDTPDNIVSYIKNNQIDFNLSKKINEAKNIQKGNYTNETFSHLQKTIQDIDAMLIQKNISQNDMNIALLSLTNAISNLKLATDEFPIINANDIFLKIGDNFDPLNVGVTASDLEDGDITNNIIVTYNDVNTQKVGKYNVTYEVSDSQNNKSSKSISVIVEIKNLSNPQTGENQNYLAFYILLPSIILLIKSKKIKINR